MKSYASKGLLLGLLVALMGAAPMVATDFQRVEFGKLAALEYNPAVPEATKKKRIVRDEREYLEQFVASEVLALDGKSVEIPGYMMPLSMKGDKVDEFLLLPDTSGCCFGQMPAFNEFVFARAKKGTLLYDNVPIRIRGKLKVEEVWQEGFFSHLYFVEVEEVVMGFGRILPPGI